MKITGAACSRGMTGFFFDDQRAIKAGASMDGSAYKGRPETEGFSSVRQAGESVGIMLLMEDGSVAVGDCAAVQYSGAGGRDPLFLSDLYRGVIEKHVFPELIGAEADEFRPLAGRIDGMINPDTGKQLHTAIRYGVTQALLNAVSISRRKLMAEVMAGEYGTQVSECEIPIFTQSGDSRYENADKMIMKRAGSLPHGLINNIPEKLGYKGEKLVEYVEWLSARIKNLGGADYFPAIHIDVYGTVGMIFG
ncbi:MAG: methylaspartate ammonia-lyase, partial [Clostridia bacterium]|nr:methylaspartate ammonia-lyase [Clostridia bacterium]